VALGLAFRTAFLPPEQVGKLANALISPYRLVHRRLLSRATDIIAPPVARIKRPLGVPAFRSLRQNGETEAKFRFTPARLLPAHGDKAEEYDRKADQRRGDRPNDLELKQFGTRHIGLA
jgi:hypothetical protein